MYMGKLNCLVLLVLSHMSVSAWAGQIIEDVVVVALSPLDKTAVVRLPNHSMQVLKPGDSIQGTELRLTKVLTNKLEFEGRPVLPSPNGTGRKIWVHKAVRGLSKVEYSDANGN